MWEDLAVQGCSLANTTWLRDYYPYVTPPRTRSWTLCGEKHVGQVRFTRMQDYQMSVELELNIVRPSLPH